MTSEVSSRVARVPFALLGGYWLPALSAHSKRLGKKLGVDYTTGSAEVALTFDDGPHPEGTPATLSILRDHNAHAIFFLVGEQVARYPELTREIAAEGHEIALHCYQHRNLLRLPPHVVKNDLERAAATIEDAGGVGIKRYRPPYGIFNAASLLVARTQRWQPLLWMRWGRDWEKDATAESIHQRLTNRLTAGDVLLLHDADYYSAANSWKNTVAALPRVLETVSERGLALLRQP